MRRAETVFEALKMGREILSKAGIETAALDARLLLQAVLKCDHADLILHDNRQLTEIEGDHYVINLVRRQKHEPVSRIVGIREFYGRDFEVNRHVLDPRADTEVLVNAALAAFPAEQEIDVLELGCGSGAVIVTLLAERPHWDGFATDISNQALNTTLGAAIVHGVSDRLSLFNRNWFAGMEGRYDLIVSNPPYIPLGDIAGLAPDVRDHDPLTALDGGHDGLDPYRTIAAGAAAHLVPNGRLMVEIGAGQEIDIQSIFESEGAQLESQKHDLAGHIRVLVFRWASTID